MILRTYGKPPFRAAVVHGGPGAYGEMAPVARELSSVCGVLEPILIEDTLEGQIGELKTAVEQNTSAPVILIGHSWGAWLCYIMSAYHPELVKKLVLVGSGPYEYKYVPLIEKARLSRFSSEQIAEHDSIMKHLNDPAVGEKHAIYARLGELACGMDSYDPLPSQPIEEDRLDIAIKDYHGLLSEVYQMRRDGSLLELAHRIRCQVLAIHGDYDMRPAEGVAEPLSAIISDFRMVVLKNCGHDPWNERQARDEFYRLLKEELRSA